MTFIEGLQSAAVSMVVAGNEGIAPFLTLFIVGVIEKSRPELLAMGETMENIIASWPGLLLLGVMSVVEFVSKCVPVVDEIVDSIMIWIVPFMSVLGTLSTMGLVTVGGGDDAADAAYDDEGRRLNAASGALLFLQICLIIVGICLALSMHFFKMLVRLIGVGWLTGILTVVEVGWCITTVTMAIYIQQVAIFVAVIMVAAAGYVVKRKWWDKRHGGEEGEGEDQQIHNEGESTGNYQATDNKGSAGIPSALATPV